MQDQKETEIYDRRLAAAEAKAALLWWFSNSGPRSATELWKQKIQMGLTIYDKQDLVVLLQAKV